MVDNPKERGSESYKRYQRYQLAKTLKEIVELSATAKSPVSRQQQRTKARADIVNDFLRGYILFPTAENRSTTHFVNAAELASKHKTRNIHSLYSRRELREARVHESKKAEARTAALFAAYEEKGYVTFNEQIEFMWDKDPPPTFLNGDGGALHERACAVAFSALVDGDAPEPSNYKQATDLRNPEKEQWRASIARERAMLEQQGTWRMVPKKSIGKHKLVKCRYVFKRKRIKGDEVIYKSRLVACGYSQVAGESFSLDELYASVMAYSSARFLMSYGCQKGMLMSQCDISSAYLQSELDEDIYMVPPPDMWVDGKPPVDDEGTELCLKLQRGLWSKSFKEFILGEEMGFVEMTGDTNVYLKRFKLDGRDEELVIGQYVDDSLILASSSDARKWLMDRLGKRFPVNASSSGEISFEEPGLLLGMNVRYSRTDGILQFEQRQAIERLAQKLGVTSLPPRTLPIAPDSDLPKLKAAEVEVNKYLSILGSCLHITQVSRPDIAFAVGLLSRHAATPGEVHLRAALDLVKYLYSTRHMYIQYTRDRSVDGGNTPQIFGKGWKDDRTIEERLVATTPDVSATAPTTFVDADHGGDKDTKRSTSGLVVMMNGGPVTWFSRLQKLTALSSAESDIFAVVDAAKEALHIRLLCEEMGVRPLGKPMRIYEDNTACIQMGHSLRGSNSARHFQLRLRFLHERIRNGEIEFAKVDTKEQLADGFTKALPLPAYVIFRGAMLKEDGQVAADGSAKK